MYQIDNSSSAATKPAHTAEGTKGFFHDGTGNDDATIVTAEFLNTIQDELVNVLDEGGIAQNKADDTQLASAINQLVADGSKQFISNGDMSLDTRRGAEPAFSVNGGVTWICDRIFCQQNLDSNTAVEIKLAAWNDGGTNDATLKGVEDFERCAQVKCTQAITNNDAGNTKFFTGFRYGIEYSKLTTLFDDDFTLSFYLKSSVAGKFSVGWFIPDVGTILTGKSLVKQFEVTTANVAQKFEITFSAIARNSLPNNFVFNDTAIHIFIAGLNYGSYAVAPAGLDVVNTGDMKVACTDNGNYLDTINHTLQLTGLQIDVGSKAKAFRHQSIQSNLIENNRYIERIAHLEFSGHSTRQHGEVIGIPISQKRSGEVRIYGKITDLNTGTEYPLSSPQHIGNSAFDGTLLAPTAQSNNDVGGRDGLNTAYNLGLATNTSFQVYSTPKDASGNYHFKITGVIISSDDVWS